MPAPVKPDNPQPDRMSLVIRGVPDLTAELANAIYQVSDGDCEVAMREGLLYVKVPAGPADGWAKTPALLAAVRATVVDAELVRVEAADMATAAERAHEPLRSSA